MKIQTINNQISSKGIYIDRSKENNGNWKMAYKPYSWELDTNAKPYIAPKEQIDMYASSLPTNEEFYTAIENAKPAVSKDIYGTISYYQYPAHINNGKMRRDVIQEEAMGREESLEVYVKKLSHSNEALPENLEINILKALDALSKDASTQNIKFLLNTAKNLNYGYRKNSEFFMTKHKTHLPGAGGFCYECS